MAQQLLKTKFHLPAVRDDLVRRPRLTDLIDRGVRGRLTVIVAPAGAGKSTLVSEWRASKSGRERLFAWLSLDDADSDPVRFFTYFAAALDGIRPGTGDTAMSLFQASSMGAERSGILTALINEISEIEDDFVLGLDDYHVITDTHIHEMMSIFVEQMPQQMHLILATRHDPQLPLARLRARGDLTEVRGRELQFDTSEAAGMFSAIEDRTLPEELVASLTEQTEGWAAGLQLFGLSMRGRELPNPDLQSRVDSYGGGQKFVFDYLAGEIFDQCDEPTREFLLKTSLLDRMNGSICDQITGMVDGDATLRRLADQNLFLVPLDDDGNWYRYHHLFRDFVRSRANGLGQEMANQVHRDAAAWLEEAGMVAEAIDQSQFAGDHDTVARLLVANFEEFQRLGHYLSISSWVSSLPDEMVRQRPRLALIYGVGTLLSEHDLDIVHKMSGWADEAISEIESNGGIDPNDDIDGTVVGIDGLDALKGEVLALTLFHAAWELPSEQTTELAVKALALLPEEKHHVRGLIHLFSGEVHIGLGDMKSAQSILQKGVDEARAADDSPLLVYGLSGYGQVNVARGRLEDGRRAYEDALTVGQGASAEANWVMCVPHTWLAEVFLEKGDISKAMEHSRQAQNLANKSPMMGFALNARTTAAQVSLAAGERAVAIEQLEEARQFAKGFGSFDFSTFLASVMLKVFRRTGDLESASDVVLDQGLSPDVAVDFKNEELVTAYAGHLIDRGNYEEADQLLSRVTPVLRDGGRVQHEIHALVLQSQARELSGSRALAIESLGRATKLGEPGRFNRSFTGEGPVVAGLLNALAEAVRRGRGPGEAGSPNYLTFLLQQIVASPEPSAGTILTSESEVVQISAQTLLPEPLSDREIEVLTLIASGASNQQIAEQMIISMSTVKSHINRAYRKLDVGTRTQAVATARQLGIV
ncbi:MAG: hypothetical protein HQ478_03035 [Chloroflexi bacterium]|nr:hypothetical protein [Chloroflexota bacterium]